jgi:Family of unknown function (DUF6102)/TrbL/VirB6 plasmid conjugal transfer protein
VTALRMFVVFAGAVAILSLSSVAHADDTPPASTPVATPAPSGGGSGGIRISLPDPKQWAADVFNQVLVNLLNGLAGALHALVGAVLGSSLNFITQTPPAGSYGSPTVQALWNVTRAIADSALVIVAMVGGFNLLARSQSHATYHDLMELLPRLALGALLANTSLTWGQLAIDANNALCNAIGQATLPAWSQADVGTQLLVDVIGVLIYLVTSLLLLLQMLMRLALVDVLLVVSPLALLCWVLPQTQGWARLWTSAFFGSVFTQFVQVVALKLGASLLTEVTPMAPDAALLAVFLGVAVLTLTLKIPGLLRTHVGDGLGFVRSYVYRQGAHALEGSGGKPTTGGP